MTRLVEAMRKARAFTGWAPLMKTERDAARAANEQEEEMKPKKPDRRLTEADAVPLAEMIAGGTVKAEAVTRAYLDRIAYDGPVEPTATVLSAIHWAHLQSVPFENLDIRPLGLAIDFDLSALQDKIVRRRRGGFCYELNGLLDDSGYGISTLPLEGGTPLGHSAFLASHSFNFMA